MAMRRPNYQLVKSLFIYTIDEIAALFGVHKNTVRDWIKHRGLPKVDDNKRPILVRGCDLREFLQKRREKNKRKCQPGEIYCVKCRKCVNPAADIADYRPRTTTLGNLEGICPICGSLMNRAVSLAKLDSISGKLTIRMLEAPGRLNESAELSVNCDLNRGAIPNALQRR